MEETIWLYFSIIAVLVALSIIGGLVYQNAAKMQHEHLTSSLEELASQCDFVCATAEGTNLPVTVTLPSGVYVYTKNDKICGVLDDRSRCRLCDCPLKDYVVDLNTSFARSAFKNHEYRCYFERIEDGVEMDCQG